MERMTMPDDKGMCRGSDGEVCCPDENCTDECLQERMGKLWEYENIGTVEEFAELKQAKSDGRLVVLSEPMIPLVCSDDMTDSDVYCPKCGETLSGGWEKADADCSLKLFQCFHCGQSIDGSRVITREAAEAALAEMEERE